MKIRPFIALAALTVSSIAVSAIPAHAAVETYTPDVVHSNVLFKVKHSDISYVFGRFNDFDAQIKWDTENPANSSIAFTIKTASVDTNNERRDNHLRSPDFFNARQHPEISFQSKKVEKTGDNTYRVSGDVSMLGQAKPVSFTWTHTGAGENNRGEYRAGGIATFTVKRSDFGMDFMIGPVSDEVEMTISLQNVRQ